MTEKPCSRAWEGVRSHGGHLSTPPWEPQQMPDQAQVHPGASCPLPTYSAHSQTGRPHAGV